MNEIELLERLVSINSENPPGNEKKIALFIKDFLDDLNLQTELVEFEKNRCNLIASIGKNEGLMLNGHMDTVPVGNTDEWKYNPFGELRNDRFYGRGSVDMKGGIAAILMATRNLLKSKVEFKKRLLLAFVADEEVGLRGSKTLIERKLIKGVKYGVIAEPTKFKIMRAQKGIMEMKIVFRGKSAHGSKPESGVNAIYKASDFIQEIKVLIAELKNSKNPILGSGTINIGKISGGTNSNVVPDFCEIQIDRRLIPRETPEIVMNQIKTILKKLDLEDNSEVILSRLPMEIPEDSELIQLLKTITKTETFGESAYTEAELYYRNVGVQCVVCGPGDLRRAHTSDEYIKISELKRGISVYEKLIKKWCC